MPICNRRMFMSHLVVGTAALAVVGRAYADTSASGTPAATTPTTGTSPNPSSSTGCGNCAFYTPAASGELFIDLVDRVLLADAAKVELHALGELEPRIAPAQALETDEREQRRDRRRRRDVCRAVEMPDPAQHPGGDVEPTTAQVVAFSGEVEQPSGLRIDLERPAAGGMDRGEHAVVAVTAELALDAPALGRGERTELAHFARLAGLDEDLTRARHRREGRGEETRIARLDRERATRRTASRTGGRWH